MTPRAPDLLRPSLSMVCCSSPTMSTAVASSTGAGRRLRGRAAPGSSAAWGPPHRPPQRAGDLEDEQAAFKRAPAQIRYSRVKETMQVLLEVEDLDQNLAPQAGGMKPESHVMLLQRRTTSLPRSPTSKYTDNEHIQGHVPFAKVAGTGSADGKEKLAAE